MLFVGAIIGVIIFSTDLSTPTRLMLYAVANVFICVFCVLIMYVVLFLMATGSHSQTFHALASRMTPKLFVFTEQDAVKVAEMQNLVTAPSSPSHSHTGGRPAVSVNHLQFTCTSEWNKFISDIGDVLSQAMVHDIAPGIAPTDLGLETKSGDLAVCLVALEKMRLKESSQLKESFSSRSLRTRSMKRTLAVPTNGATGVIPIDSP